jgi:hypothetical protein
MVSISTAKKFSPKNRNVNLLYALIAITLIMISILFCKLMGTHRESMWLFGLGGKKDEDKIQVDASGSTIERFERMTPKEREAREREEAAEARRLSRETLSPSEQMELDYEVDIDQNGPQIIAYFDPAPPEVLEYFQDSNDETRYKLDIVQRLGNKQLQVQGATPTEIGDAMNKLTDTMWLIPSADMKMVYDEMEEKEISIKKQGNNLIAINKPTGQEAMLTTENCPLSFMAVMTALHYKAKGLEKPRFTLVESSSKTPLQLGNILREQLGITDRERHPPPSPPSPPPAVPTRRRQGGRQA